MAIVATVENGTVVSSSTSESTTSANNDLGYDEFLQLLCAEMQYQDPLEPTSNTEYVAQLATFSQMEAMLNVQDSVESSKANDLVGKYVMVKSTSSSTGETTAVAGFVDYVQYENNEVYVYVNGSAYSLDDIYQVADTEYMEAITMASTFESAVSALPDADDLTIAYKDDVESLTTYYESMNTYQLSYVSSDTLTKYKELVAKMAELTADDSSDSDSSTDSADSTDSTDSTTSS